LSNIGLFTIILNAKWNILMKYIELKVMKVLLIRVIIEKK